MFFEKKVLIYRKRDRETWDKIKKILKDAGIRGVSAGHYTQEKIPVGGYSMLDPRDFGRNGRINRDIYYVRVPVSAESSALEAIRSHAVNAEIVSDEELAKDAPERHPVSHND